jgi:hypothetical protein
VSIHPDPRPKSASRRFLLLPLLALTGWLLVRGCLLAGDSQVPATPAPPTPQAERMLAGPPTVATPPEPERRPAAPVSPAPPDLTPLDFAAVVDELATLGEATASLALQDEIDAARQSDQEARALFAALLDRFADAGERAIDLLTTIPAAPAPHDAARRGVAQLVLGAECSRRHKVAEAAGDRSRIDGLVHAVLATMPQSPALTEAGTAVLDGAPFLRLGHEAAVQNLVELAGRREFPRAAATRLLLTLWDNLQRSGERSAADLASLAMLLIADPDPSKRTAACRQLLADPRHRLVALAWLREHRDLAVATELAQLAAQELPPTDALAVLRDLGPLLPSSPGAYMALGFRAPQALTEAYQELLAADSQPAVRSDLVAGLAMADPEHALPVVELALASDPSPAVRVQAMLTLTATAAATHGEQACQQALDDPAVARDPARLAVVVFALQNLEAAGLVNAVDRLGQRLRSCALREDTRLALEQLLARALPGGQTSNTAGR